MHGEVEVEPEDDERGRDQGVLERRVDEGEEPGVGRGGTLLDPEGMRRCGVYVCVLAPQDFSGMVVVLDGQGSDAADEGV